MLGFTVGFVAGLMVGWHYAAPSFVINGLDLAKEVLVKLKDKFMPKK